MPTPPDFTAGTALAAASLDKIGLWKVANGTATAGTLIIANCFSSDYDNYRLYIGATGNNGAEVTGQLRVGGTTANTNYNWALWGMVEGSGFTSYTITAQPYFTLTYGVGLFLGDIYGPNLAQQTWLDGQQNMDVFGSIYYRRVGSRHTTATAYTDLVLTIGSSITIRYAIYGYNKLT